MSSSIPRPVRRPMALVLAVASVAAASLAGVPPAALAAPSAAQLVVDLDPGPGSGVLELQGALGDRLFFRGSDGVTGAEPYVHDVSDGTTTLLADLLPGPTPSDPTLLGTVNGRFVFKATSGSGLDALFASDGTPAGTTALFDPSGTESVQLIGGAPAADLDGFLYLSVQAPSRGVELWRTDGTPGGTGEVADLSPGSGSTQIGRVEAFGGSVYFTASVSLGATHLWRTDGTSAGTQIVEPTLTGAFGLAALRSQLLFEAAAPGGSGVGVLYRTGGAPSSAVLVEDLAAGYMFPFDDLVVVGDRAYAFGGNSLLTGPGLWVTDGTDAGTIELHASISFSFQTRGIVPFGAGIAVVAGDPTTGPELWFSDGTKAGTFLREVQFGPAHRSIGTIEPHVDGWLYFDALPPGLATRQLMRTDGVTIETVTSEPTLAGVANAHSIGDRVYFQAGNATQGTELWFVDAPPPPPLVPLAPGRILETRVGADLKTVDAQFQGVGRRTAGSTLELPVAGRATVPVDASAVMLNVTAVGPDEAGFVTVFPCGEDKPNASSVNYQAGQVVPNAVLAKVGAGGKVCLFTTAATDLLVDVNGAVPAGGSPVTVVPARLLETRSGQGLDTVDGQFQGVGRVPAGGTVELTVAGRGNVPVNAAAVMLNVTAVGPDEAGFLTVFPCGEDKPNASSVNYQAGQVVPNAVLAKVGVGGKVCVFSLAATDVLVDVSGFVPLGSKPATVSPARLLETRSGPDLKTVDSLFQGVGRVAAGGTVELPVTGRGNVPGGASAVMVNVTAVAPDGAGFLTVFPCGEDKPNASSVNYQAGQVVPNAVLAKVGIGGKICIFTLAATDLLVDVTAST